MFIRLSTFQRQLQANYSWFEDKNALDADPRAIQQIVFQGIAGEDNNLKIRPYNILEKSKETVFEFYRGTAKVLWEYINSWIQ